MANYSKEELQYIASQVHPYLLELVRSNGLDVDNIEVVNDTDGITSLPAYDNRGGVKKVVRVPLSTFAKPAQDAADQLQENIASAGEAAANANEAADRANAAAEEIDTIKEDIVKAVEDAQKALDEVQESAAIVTEKVDEINSTEAAREQAEQGRKDAEAVRVTEYSDLKNQMTASIGEMDTATESALDTANHPTYIGTDNYVYIWDKQGQKYDKTDIYVKGGDGAKGEDGQDPVITFGMITTLDPGTSASAELVSNGEDANGRPVFQLNLSIPRGDKGENGSGSGNVLVSTSGLVSGKTYLFKPNQNNSAEGTFVEYEIPEIDTSTVATKSELSQGLATKQDKIDDLATIRSNAAKGATALQGVPSEYITETELNSKGYALASEVTSSLQGKQDKIEDLEDIRSGASKGATALQPNTTGDGTKFLSDDGSYKEVDDLPEGGTTGQVLTKTDEGAEWKDAQGGDLSVPIIDHGTDDTTYSVTPNVYHKWGTVGSLTLTLATAEDASVANYYILEFTSGTTATTLSLPENVTWSTDISISANRTYQINIVNNLGVIGEF